MEENTLRKSFNRHQKAITKRIDTSAKCPSLPTTDNTKGSIDFNLILNLIQKRNSIGSSPSVFRYSMLLRLPPVEPYRHAIHSDIQLKTEEKITSTAPGPTAFRSSAPASLTLSIGHVHRKTKKRSAKLLNISFSDTFRIDSTTERTLAKSVGCLASKGYDEGAAASENRAAALILGYEISFRNLSSPTGGSPVLPALHGKYNWKRRKTFTHRRRGAAEIEGDPRQLMRINFYIKVLCRHSSR